MTKEITEEQKKRGEEFVKEYGELVKKYKYDFAAYPMYVPDGDGGFKTVIQQTAIDISEMPQKSPIIAS